VEHAHLPESEQRYQERQWLGPRLESLAGNVYWPGDRRRHGVDAHARNSGCQRIANRSAMATTLKNTSPRIEATTIAPHNLAALEGP